MKTKEKPTWLGYLNALKSSHCESEKVDLTRFDHFFKANNGTHPFSQHIAPFVYILDYRNGSYLNMSENFGGYKSESFLNGGIHHTVDIYQKDHLRIFNQEVFPDRLAILKGIKGADCLNYVFSHNLMIKKKSGEYDHYLQRSCFLSDEQGQPIFSMGTLVAMTQYNLGNQIIQSIDRVNKDEDCETIFKKTYYLNEENRLFSKREKEVLLWMAEGLSSKMIADKLFLSEHTVINHRRNMQDKSNMPNAIALVSFAIKSGVI